MEDIIYFEVNNWFAGRDYPDAEPFFSWLSNDLDIRFRDEQWVRKNGLCVVFCFIDMSQNFCVSAPRRWVEENCPELLTKFQKFLRYPDKDGDVYSRFDILFLPYKKENIGITEIEYDHCDNDDEYEEDNYEE